MGCGYGGIGVHYRYPDQGKAHKVSVQVHMCLNMYVNICCIIGNMNTEKLMKYVQKCICIC